MEFISLYSGIGGIELGFERAGMRCVAQVEKDPYCNQVLAKHWPDIPRFENDEEVGAHNLPAAQLITGGFPCQPFSTAGEQRGEADPRNRWPQMRRIVAECHPDWVVAENVTGIIGLYLDTVLDDLEAEGYEVGAFVFPVASLGAPHLRHRVWILAHTKSRGFGWRRNQQGSEGKVQFGANADGRGSESARADSDGGHDTGHSSIRAGGTFAELRSGRGTNKDLADADRQRLEGRLPSTRKGAVFIAGDKDGGGVAIRNTSSEGLSDWPSLALEEFSPLAQLERPDSGDQRNIPDAAGLRCNYGRHTERQRVQRAHETRDETGRQSPWPPEPRVGRVAHGVSRRVDRLRGLGNAVSPAQSYHIGRLIMAVEQQIARK